MKEDERETLAHMIQNIDEQEIFMEFVAKAETIKEAWQIAKIFENKKKEFIDSIQEYDSIITDKEQQLKMLTREITDANALLKDANNELETIKLQLEEMRSKAQLYKTKILQGQQTQSLDSLEKQEKALSTKEEGDFDILDLEGLIEEFEPLNVVSVHVKNGATAMARVAQIIYPEELYRTYQRAGSRLFRLKNRINELELTNKKLSIELRDLSEEDNFKENMRNLDSHDNYNTILPSLASTQSTPSTPQALDVDSLDIETRIQRVDKKKERVEEIFSKLDKLLSEDDNIKLKK